MKGQLCVPLVLCALVVNVGVGNSEKLLRKPVAEVRAVSIEAGSLNWVFVDSMNNCSSMASNMIKPLVYDPYSGTVAIIHGAHSGYGMGSGQVWYNISTDEAAAWSRISELNAGNPTFARHPSATIAYLSDLFCWSAPQINPSAFGYIIFGVDILGAGAPYAVTESSDISGDNTRIVAADDDHYIWWLAQTNQGTFHLWRTEDYVTVDEFDPWPANDFDSLGHDIGLAYRNGVLYLGVFSTFPGDSGAVFNVAYSASTDRGTTWSAWNGPNIGIGDWRTLPGIAGTAYTDWHPKNSFDMVVDANGHVHFFGIVVDDVGAPTDLAVVEIFQTESGWSGDVVSDGLSSTTRTDYGGVDQMGYHVSSAISLDGYVMAVTWLSAPAEGDSIPDIYGSARSTYLPGSWNGENLTNTPDLAELLVHLAPTMQAEGFGLYRMFFTRVYECASDSYPPDCAACAHIHVASKLLGYIIEDVSERVGIPLYYNLDQNHPNPFNPQTEIGFEIRDLGFVSLKIYDLLGREIATLVNEELAPGTYTRQWDASGYPSSVYFYRLSTSNFVQTKKLVLLR